MEMGCQPKGLCALTNLNEKDQNRNEKPSTLVLGATADYGQFCDKP